MILKENYHIPYYLFPHLVQYHDIVHGIFTKKGGHSRGSFKSLNIGFNTGDDPALVKKNRQTLLKCLDLDKQADLVFSKQVHGKDIRVITQSNKFSLNEFHEKVPEFDAMVTNIPGKLLLIQVADCQPVLLYDPVKKVIANIHSGWKGSVQNIIGRTVDAMASEFNCLPGNILTGIGPSLGPCCAEFINYKKEIPEAFRNYKVGSHHFDFWKISHDQLCDAGVLSGNISIGNICTKCHSDMFYSYRKEKITGRFAAVIGLR